MLGNAHVYGLPDSRALSWSLEGKMGKALSYQFLWSQECEPLTKSGCSHQELPVLRGEGGETWGS